MTSGERSPLEKRYAHTGCCSVCGQFSVFSGSLRPGLHPRDQFACRVCGTTLRYRDQATAIVEHFLASGATCVDDLVQRILRRREPNCGGGVAILEFGLRGPFVSRFRALPGYRQAYFFDDVPLGDEKDGVYCEDITRTSFADETFDLIVTSDVMEHVADWRQAVAEVARLLRPGGAHIFTVPLMWPIPPTSVARAKVVAGEVRHHVEASYHVSGTGSKALVFTDFGEDLLDGHQTAGLDAWFASGHMMLDGLHRSGTVVATKPARQGARREEWQMREMSLRRSSGGKAKPAAGRERGQDAPALRVNRVRCLVCGWRGINAGSDPLAAGCRACRATVRSMHLAATLLRLGSRGTKMNLSHFAGGGGFGARAVLDLTGDPSVRMACRLASSYRDRPLVQSTHGPAACLGAEIATTVASLEPASADLLLLRDVLRLVPDLSAFVAEIRRILRPGGAVVFQDRFTLPQAVPPEEGERQLVVRYDDASPLGIEELWVPVRRNLGADALGALADHGLQPMADTPPAPSLIAHRHVAIVGRVI